MIVHSDIDRVARDSYSRLIAILAARTGDIALAEDALSDAFQRAIEMWPDQGVPNSPEAWLLTVARNRLKDHYKSAAVSRRTEVENIEEKLVTLDIAEAQLSQPSFPDERLKLMFVCAHPAIGDNVRTPLMLQTVLGLPVEQIARLFLVPSPTLAKRLTRAKQKIKSSVVPFEIPDDEVTLATRLDDVLEAIYGAFAAGIEAEEEQQLTLVSESAYLIRLLIALLPQEPEVLGLAAIIHLSAARLEARYDEAGALVPLGQQNVDMWDKHLVAEGRALLEQAGRHQRIGRFQLEALIQSVHCDRLDTDSVNWSLLLSLYEALSSIRPTTGSLVAQAAVISEAVSPQKGLEFLHCLKIQGLEQFQPYQATRGALLLQSGEPVLAAEAFDKAISLTTNKAARLYLQRQRNSL